MDKYKSSGHINTIKIEVKLLKNKRVNKYINKKNI